MIVGMAGFFAAAAKPPFSTFIIVSELTGGYCLLLLPLGLHPRVRSLRRAIHLRLAGGRPLALAGPPGSYVCEVLAEVRVREFLSPKPSLVVLHPTTR